MQRKLGRHEFVRSHGLGNDYLVVDGETFGVAIDQQNVRALCDRHTGVGSDGILVATAAPAGFDAAVRIFNPDGSEAEKSGNGVRIYAKFCLDYGYASGDSLRIHTLGGAVTARTISRGPDATRLRLSMGQVTFLTQQQPLTVGDRDFTATSLSIGNPHAVIFDAPFDDRALETFGPRIEHHAQFPQRINVQFVELVSREEVRALIWERGAGKTASSGSSACAVAAACVAAGKTDRHVRVVMPGGTLEVFVGEDYQIDQIGPAQEIARGTLSAELVSTLRRAP